MKHIILIVSLLMGVTLGVQAQPKALFDKTTHEFGNYFMEKSGDGNL